LAADTEEVRLLAPWLAVAAVPLLGIVALQHEQRSDERRLAAVASEVAGRPVDVHCPGLLKKLVDISPNSGSVYFDEQGRPGNFAELNDETCSTLSDFAEGDTGGGDSLRVARALHVLAHESFHVAGVRDEAETDCFALQRVAFVAGRLGGDPAEAQQFAALARADRAVTAPAEYRTPLCYDGGPLDLDPASRVWP
jgi:hypothetical protein